MNRFKKLAAVGAALAMTTTGVVAGIAVADSGGGDTNPVIDMPSTSSGSNGYSLVDAGKPGSGNRFSSINNLSVDFAVLEGGCGGGSPRFTVTMTDPNDRSNSAFLTAYLGTPPSFTCGAPGDGWMSSGNLASASSGNRWAVGNSGSYVSYNDPSIQAYSDWRVTDVQLIVDSGWAFPNGEDIVVRNVALNKNVTNAGAIR